MFFRHTCVVKVVATCLNDLIALVESKFLNFNILKSCVKAIDLYYKPNLPKLEIAAAARGSQQN